MAEARLRDFGKEVFQAGRQRQVGERMERVVGGSTGNQEAAAERADRFQRLTHRGFRAAVKPRVNDPFGGVVTDDADVAKFTDLLIGVVPIVNLEWIQKIHRDNAERGYSAEATVDTILRRMPDYINYITPQFSRTDINFQRVSTVDTSNPFITRDIPTPDESFVVIRFKDPAKFDIDFPFLLSMIHDSFMSRRNTLVVPGGKMGLAMEIILAPIIEKMMDSRNV